MQTVPVVGSYIYSPGDDGRQDDDDRGANGRLWQVSAVVFDGSQVKVFALQVLARLAAELLGAWAAWGKPTGSV